ncbi:MAG: ABC transporter permease [Sinomicrobium sp.]|nr:ABC transporter permease [Sinomicrobium sp.]
MYFLFYIVKRYLVAKSSRNVVNIINGITFVVVVIGAAALLIVLSGFSGLKTFSIAFSNTFDPDLKALSARGKFFSLTPDEEAKLNTVKGLAVYAREVEERVFLTYKQKNHVVYIKGIDGDYNKVTNVDSILYFGVWRIAHPDEVVIGMGTSSLLGISLNDYENPLKIVAPKPGKGGISGNAQPYNQLPAIVTGIYAINEELDKKYIFAALPAVQQLLDKQPSEITGINFKLKENADKEQVRASIMSILNDKVVIKTREQLNDVLYKMLNTENLAIYFIFTLVLIIALFNVVGAIFIMILDKKENLRTLFSLGVTVKQLKSIFFFQGLSVTAVGGIGGIALGLLLLWTQLYFGWLKITPSLAYPVEIRLFNIAVVMFTILVLGAVASGIASGRISRKLIG